MLEMLKEMYSRSSCDSWSEDLIAEESERIHSSCQEIIKSMLDLISDPNSDSYDKEWARSQITALLS